jgi:hypothetical protein
LLTYRIAFSDEGELNFAGGVGDFMDDAGVDPKLSTVQFFRVRNRIVQIGEDSMAFIVTAIKTSASCRPVYGES